MPQWYQSKFLPSNSVDKELYYLDLKPGTFTDPRGIIHQKRALKRLGFKYCFSQEDLYTSYLLKDPSIIEKVFFGEIDRKGHEAVSFFSDFKHADIRPNFVKDLILYMSTQKLRTPKGLAWIANQIQASDKDILLRFLTQYRQLFGTIWSESVWLIADASKSTTKFIVSDHPVTVYNRRCGPRSEWCRGSNDPDIRYHGSHTIFPLSFDKILILTNLSWVRNPYQSPTAMRPHPEMLRGSLLKFTDIQTFRYLSEQEVLEINFIIKSRAYKYIGAAKEEWLYPEKSVSKSNWADFGGGYLLMPDPRGVSFSSEVIIGHRDGTATGFDAYGRRPWQSDYNIESKNGQEFTTFHRFQGDFALLFGPNRRGRAFNMGSFDPEEDTPEMHRYHLSLAKRKKKN